MTVAPNTVQVVTLSLQATDADKDGFVDVNGGTDCKDDNEKINPGVDELCNDTDDNCDGVSDEVHFAEPGLRGIRRLQGASPCRNPTTQAQYCDTSPQKTVYPDADFRGQVRLEGCTLASSGGDIPSGYLTGLRRTAATTCTASTRDAGTLCDGEDNQLRREPWIVASPPRTRAART